MPVVGVDNVGPPTEGGDDAIERRPAKERKAIGVVPEAIKIGSAAELTPFRDEVDRHIRTGKFRLEHTGGDHARSHRNLQRDRMDLDAKLAVAKGGLDGGIGGHDDTHVVAQFRESLGQGTDDIR